MIIGMQILTSREIQEMTLKFKRKSIQCLVLGTCLIFTSISYAETSKLESARINFEKKKYKKAHNLLNEIPFAELDPKRMALVEFFRGRIYLEENKPELALKSFAKSLQLGTRIEDIAYYYQGQAYLKSNQPQKALVSFEKVESLETSDFLREKAKLHRAEILASSESIDRARDLYKTLERKMRRSEFYPDVLWALLNIDLKMKKRLDACFWGRKLYKDYPNYEPIAHWGLTWSENKVSDLEMDCKDSLEDQKRRIKRLQWMGASAKAQSELKVFEKTKVDQFIKDMVASEFLVNEGLVVEAFRKLKPYYKDQNKRRDEDFISLFSKAAARAGEIQAATGIYDQAHRNLSGSRGQQYLFQAAHLCYQNQDYDGALRRFEKIKKTSPYSSYGKQANWYIPWIYYLKGQHQKSYDLMKLALKNKRRMLPSFVGEDKVKYWMAMSMKKRGNLALAQDLFLEVSHDQYLGYYSIAAVHRLRELVGSRGLASLEVHRSANLNENWIPHLRNPEINLIKEDENQTLLSKLNESYYTEWESLPYMREYLDMDLPTRIYTTMTEPKFRDHIERARELSIIGMTELAKWELYSVEGRTKNEDYLKTLMFEYHRNEIFHRSSYIGTTHFGKARTHLGLQLGASLWHFVYPRAFEKEVVKNSQKSNVPPEFVWSIMKAETNFRPDAMSPVGARGLIQVMTHTGRKVASFIGKEIQPDQLFEPAVGIEIGTSYLNRVLKKFDQKIPLAAAAYNGGPHRVHLWLHQFGDLEMDEFIEHIPFLETRNYVKRVTQYYTLYNLLYNKNPDASSWLSQSVDVFPPGPPPTQENWDAL